MDDKDKKICFVACWLLVILWICSGCHMDNRVRAKPTIRPANPELRMAILRGLLEGWGPKEITAEVEYQRMKNECETED